MNSIILMSHGNMAEEVLNSAKMIIGNSIDYPTVNMKQDDGIEGTIKKLKKALEVYKESSEIVIMVDLLGGTPCNAALLEASSDNRIKIISGLNLGMVVESAFSDAKELAVKLEKIGKDNISIVEPTASLLSDDE
ncbi:PTS mannose transporter subunit IIA [Clostridioides difficile]|uniref:PTS sugar transporter subunit IIA n=1 Tax=unclassified Clostridioides TaxID=2635829 RepID=UPI0006BBE180|nr:PTS mannose transporter subunit IIA [Clostridioides difficile]KPI48585.1 PTS mannose transporter subunit IIA [Clostridioides difficile]MDB3086364.1 PTS mannose transporter subunit IIA [Clostridioides difficile]MDI0266199.1 PTS sugar transporter subunit IIA [Clostridioides difficile]MDI7816602.1 PTS sugar transporter subunit IIA [Clostridioides difficile]